MKSMAKWILGAAVVAGGLGLAATPAKAAEFGVYIGGPAAYVPPCPGPGYEWTAGYYSDGYWVPGRWVFAGYRAPVVRYYGDRDDYRYYYHRDRDDWRDYRDRDDWRRRDWEHERHEWREHHDRDDRYWDHDHDHWRR
jgi:hypothetical protein